MKERNSEKKAIMLEHDGGELANQLWAAASVFAYALERGYTFQNFCFFEYARYFNTKHQPENFLMNIFFRLPFSSRRRSSFKSRLWRGMYKIMVAKTLALFSRNRIIYSSHTSNGIYHLPPTLPAKEELSLMEGRADNIYFSQVSGGMFRNPAGLLKFRREVVAYFSPSDSIQMNVAEIMGSLRERYKKIIGIHLRQTDYAVFKNGRYLVREERAVEIAKEYLDKNGFKADDVCFAIASDAPMDEALWRGLQMFMSKNNAVTDLFMLSGCDAIIGSDSTFGYFAAYCGNIPHIVMKNKAIDWQYYSDKKQFFQNNYLTVMRPEEFAGFGFN